MRLTIGSISQLMHDYERQQASPHQAGATEVLQHLAHVSAQPNSRLKIVPASEACMILTVQEMVGPGTD